MNRTLISILILLICTPVTNAEERTDSTAFLFRQGKAALDPHIGQNADNISRLNDILSDSTGYISIRGIRITGSASPEGAVDLNSNLSDRRARTILNRFAPELADNDDILDIGFTGRDWVGLRRLVMADSNVPYRSEVIGLLDSIIAKDNRRGGERASDRNLEHLHSLRGGVPYKYLYSNLFPSLRKATVSVDYKRSPRKIVPPGPFRIFNLGPVMPQSRPEIRIPTLTLDHESSHTRKPFYMSLRTNLLYDAAALPTLGAEFYLGKNLSIAAEWTYGWWDRDRTHRYWRAYGGDIELRWWFGKAAHRKPLTGHHIGVYAGVVTYDFEFGARGYMGGIPGGTLWDRCMRTAGVEYGYSLPIANRLNLDFTIGIGYLGGKYVKYDPEQDFYVWKSTNRLAWFGPTKAEISLVWLIGSGNCNNALKGGRK